MSHWKTEYLSKIKGLRSLGFSRSRNEPSYIRSDPGSVVGIDALRSSHC